MDFIKENSFQFHNFTTLRTFYYILQLANLRLKKIFIRKGYGLNLIFLRLEIIHSIFDVIPLTQNTKENDLSLEKAF